jgi:hypothetical protein
MEDEPKSRFLNHLLPTPPLSPERAQAAMAFRLSALNKKNE